MTRRYRCPLIWLAVLGALASPAFGYAAGPPLPSSASGRAGVVVPGGSERLVTRRAGPETLVMAVRRGDGAVLRSRHLSGRWSVPAVTLDNATTGLSANGRTLVLARPTRDFPPAMTRLAVLDAHSLLVRRRITLPGFFTVDAISPDGRWAYVIQYSDDVLDYRVRALDTTTGGLAPDDVVDPREPDEQMGGLPMTRAVAPDGRWVYTLYSGGEETFIHALDSVGRTAACIDLEMLPPDGDMAGVRLRVSRDGLRVTVRDDGRLVATVDARSFEVSEPGEEAARPAPAAKETRSVAPAAATDGSNWPMVIVAGGVAALAALGLALAGRRRMRARTRSPLAPRA